MTMTPDDQAHERSDGLGDDGGCWGDFPIEALRIRHDSRPVHEVLRCINRKRFIMQSGFPMDAIWSTQKQSRLIESMLMRIPLPAFYLAEDDLGRMVVVDGLQRLTAIQRFVGGEFALDLPGRRDLHGNTFADLPIRMQNRMDGFDLMFYVIDHNVPEQVRLEIVERVNGGRSA